MFFPERLSNQFNYRSVMISMTKGTNEIAAAHFRDKGIKSFQNSHALEKLISKNPQYLNFMKDDQETKSLTYQIDRRRFDKALKKIAYGLYFKEHKLTWNKRLAISTQHLITTNYDSDEIAEGIKQHPILKQSLNFKGNNPRVFKYCFLDFKNRIDKLLLMTFYEYFEVWALPVSSSNSASFD